MPAAIQCTHLRKAYSSGTVALHDLNLDIEAGDSFGLLGENGAGKSTLVRLLMGFVHPSAGRIRLLGNDDVRGARPHIGYLPERQILEPRFTGRHYLAYMAELSGLFGRERNRRVDEVLAEVGLESSADQRLGAYSKGMLQRMGLAQALLAAPALLILDEPTDGLDPASRWQMHELLARVHLHGVTVLLCSHNLTEVETLCRSVAILRSGMLVTAGPLSALRSSLGITEIELAPEHDVGTVIDRCSLRALVISIHGNAFRIPASHQAAALRALVGADVSLRSVNAVRETLEEVYLRAMQRPALEIGAGP